jgi:hypothetical protein
MGFAKGSTHPTFAADLPATEAQFVSEDVYSAEGVHALLASREVVSGVFKLKGVLQDLRVFRITKDPAAL